MGATLHFLLSFGSIGVVGIQVLPVNSTDTRYVGCMHSAGLLSSRDFGDLR